MKKKNFLLALGCIVILSFNAAAQTPVCYDSNESKAVDFWLDHLYFAKCTDYETPTEEHTGAHLFGANTDYVEFNAYGAIDFKGIHVSQDGTYKVQLTYGIGWCDEQGAWVDLKVNRQFVEQLVLYVPEPSPGTIEFEAELYSDYDNIIQLFSVKDWPAMLCIQIFPLDPGPGPGTAVTQTDENALTVSCTNGMLSIDNMADLNNNIQINSVDGRLINSITTNSTTYTTPLNSGLYIVNVNGNATKVFVK